MRLVRLGRSGLYAKVDNQDYLRVSQFRWYLQRRNKRDYAQKQHPYQYLHNFILGFRGVDHRDGDGLNCIRKNLRPATESQNHANCFYRTNKSGYKGVSWSAERGLWQVHIMCMGKRHFLGRFASRHKAANAYRKAAEAMFGDFAYHNRRY